MKRKNADPMSLKKLTLSLSLVFCFPFVQAQEAATAQELAPMEEAAAELAKVVLGPTGNLRAPAIKRGKAWLIGFNEDAYADALG